VSDTASLVNHDSSTYTQAELYCGTSRSEDGSRDRLIWIFNVVLEPQ
jgi:hypothetical protein